MGTPITWEIVFIVRPGPPPGSFEPRPSVQAVLIRLYPKPGILTHRSRGMESIPAVLVDGSTVRRINVSVQKGQSPLIGSPPRKPTNKMLRRLFPSQVGYSTSAGCGSGVKVGSAVLGSPPMTGVSSGWISCPLHCEGGRPGKAVSRQQVVRSRDSRKRPIAARSATHQNRIGRRGIRRKSNVGIVKFQGLDDFFLLVV